MGRRRKRTGYDEYESPDEKIAKEAKKGGIHTDYIGRFQKTVHVANPVTTGNPELPPPGSIDSPTPRLDWILRKDEKPYRVFDGDIELEEMEDCELEALGLLKFLRRPHPEPERIEIVQKKRKTHSTHPIHFWTPHIDSYVDELLLLESPSPQALEKCTNSSCNKDLGADSFRCMDCGTSDMLCCECMVASHLHSPFHRLERWDGHHFSRTNLKTLGFRIQLGHSGGICEVPIPAFNDEFVVISSNGIHEVSLDYCGCSFAQSKPVQLLRSRLFPSTISDPKTAATFEVLKLFQLLSFNTKISGYEFYQTMARLTDNTGTRPPPDRYPVFMRIVREWRHVRLLKRMGRGHDSSGVKGTKEGECAVICPACPHPGINLPDNWKEKPQSTQWLYALFIGIDANFRLKRMNVSNNERDPPLNHGYAYMVESNKFKEYLDVYDAKIPDDKSSCNNHDAIKSASTRGGHGAAASGLGTVECSRHDMKRPVSVGDLQKGERYVNMDYFFLSSIASTLLSRIVVSYDIACQWWCNLAKRCLVYPTNSISSLNLDLVFLVPKFHLPAHIPKCQTSFSFNYTPGVGRTDGESPERGWSAANGIASSTKEMGPGSRSDTLDDHFGDYNWRKIMGIALTADTFVRKTKEAISARTEHVEAFIEFDAALPVEDTSKWTDMCKEWEADPTQPNPYVIKKTKGSTISDTDVRLRLAAEDAEALSRGENMQLHDDVSPSLLIFQGLQFEELQWVHQVYLSCGVLTHIGLRKRLAYDTSRLGLHATSLQQTKILERSNSLKRRIDAWIQIQHLYMPSVAALRARDDASASTPVAVYDMKLFLPSHNTTTLLCSHTLIQCEWDYRFAQADEALNTLRGFLLLRSHMYNSKKRHSRGQRQQTRSQKLLSDVQDKIDYIAGTYRRIHKALEQLEQPLIQVSWRSIFRPLLDEDIAGLSSLDDQGSEGRKRLSWIWKIHGTGADADEYAQAALRIEWCKARARAHRWQEECLLLAEEMRRVLEFFKWQGKNWEERAQAIKKSSSPTSDVDEWLCKGKVAYARRQKGVCDSIREHCSQKWCGLTEALTNMVDRDAQKLIECH